MLSSLRSCELLAPAGGWEQLRYAIYFGADAIYLACDRFGLRARAGNFSLEELPGAVAWAHDRSVRVYVTLNIYAHDNDLRELPAYVREIEASGADAVIVSDLGVLSVVREEAPGLDVHVSTQAAVSNAAAARMWCNLGARRIVLARELSVSQITELSQELPDDVELEAFVHGALCMAISGRCLISDFLTGRSANQGSCAQPCRWNYELREPTRPDERFEIEEDAQGTYLMNSKDLCMLEHLDDLASAGVTSFKIEGRNKKAFYVATVVNAYRHVMDGESAATWQKELESVSHRPYSTGFYYGPAQQGVEGDTYAQRCDWVAEVLGSEPIYDGLWRISCRCRNRFYEGDVLELVSPCSSAVPVVVSGLVECTSAGEVCVERASKAMGEYAFIADAELAPHDILRSVRLDPSRKN